jgi:hypothetical protein
MNEIDNIIKYLNSPKPKKASKAPYRKPESVKELENLIIARKRKEHPDLPFYAKKEFRDDTANGLTSAIIQYLQLHGHQAERINTMGRPIDNSRTFTDCIGRQRRIGGVKWIPSGSTPGSADISATIGGRSVKIEVKIGRDQQSQAQKEYQRKVEQAGGAYMIATSFDSFLEQIINIQSK